MVFGNATVQVPRDDNPDHGGGPIRRSVGVVTRAGYGMPPGGSPTMVLRTPHAVVYEPEPGGATYRGIHRMKFLPDGRIVRGGALGGSLGSSSDQLSAQDAVINIQAQYLALQQLYGRIIETYRDAGLGIPCDVLGAYNRAVYDYLHTSRDAIDAIYKGGGQVFMTVLNTDGTPALDANGAVKRRETQVPLQPGSFVPTGCPAGTPSAYSLSGSTGRTTHVATMGVSPLGAGTSSVIVTPILVAGSIVGFAIGGPIGAAVAIGSLIVVGAEAIIINWPGAQNTYQANVVSSMNASLQCLRDATAAGVTGQAAADRCAAFTKAAAGITPPSEGLGFWAWVGIIATVAAGGAGIYAYMRHKRRQGASPPAPAVVAGGLGRGHRRR